MTKTICLFAAIITTFGLVAQRLDNVKLGPDNDQNTKILKILGETSEGIFYMAAKGEQLYVQRYDPVTMVIEVSNKIEIPEKEGIKLDLEEMFLMDKQILLFATGFHKASNSYKTYSFIINEECAITSKGSLVFVMPVEKKSRGGDVTYQQSEDRSHLLLFNTSRMKAEEKTRFTMLLLNQSGEEVTQQSFDVADGEGRETVSVKGVIIDKNNDFHSVVSRAIYNRSTKERDETFSVYAYRKKNNYEPTITELSLGTNKIISSVAIAPRKDGSVSVGGFYCPMVKGKRATGLEGTFFVTVGLDGTPGEMKIQAFSDGFKRNFMREKAVEKGFDLPLTYIMRQAVSNDNDEITFVAEDYQHTQQDNSETFIYGFVVAIRVDASGNIRWEKVIKKMQVFNDVKMGFSMITGGAVSFGVGYWVSITSNKTIYYSYKMWEHEGNLVFLFNDNQKNAELGPEENRKPIYKAYNGAPYTASITDNGELSIYFEQSIGDEETVLRPKLSLVQNNKLYYISAKKSTEKVGTATLK